MFSNLLLASIFFAALHGVNGDLAAAKPKDEHAKRAELYSYQPYSSIYVPPASDGGYSSSYVGGVGLSSYVNSNGPSSVSSYVNYGPSQSSYVNNGNSLSHDVVSGSHGPSQSVSGVPGPSRGPNNNNQQHHTQPGGQSPASSSGNPAPAPGAAPTLSNLGLSVTIMLAGLTGVIAVAL